ncbi:MAG TPA: YcxB family protein [Candidatus Eisenbacteria bacterium]|nr:YcxB family protein [Candidatus Eisenbacteria bacterium]
MRALRTHYASRLRLRLDLVVMVALVVAGAVLVRSPNLPWLGVTCLVVAAVFGLMLAAAFIVIPPLVFRREPKFRDDYALEFSSAGIHFRTAHIDSRLQWSTYTRALVAPHAYLLYHGTHQFTVVPGRVFGSIEQRHAFETLLERHIPRIDRRGR